jgi:hypothetical protein
MATYRNDSSGRVPLTTAHVLAWNKVGKAFSADGMVATSGSGDSTIKLKAKKEEEKASIKRLRLLLKGVDSVAFSADGKVMASTTR